MNGYRVVAMDETTAAARGEDRGRGAGRRRRSAS